MTPNPTHLSTTADAIGEAVERWRASDARVRELHAQLARSPGGHPALWEEMLSEASCRDHHARTLGREVGRWVALGGSLELVDPNGPGARPAVPEIAEAPAAAAPPAEQAEPPAAAPPVAAEAPTPTPERARPARSEPASTAALQKLRRVGLGGAVRIEEARRRTLAQHHLDDGRRLLRQPLTPEHTRGVAAWIEALHLVDPLSDGGLCTLATAAAARLRSLQQRHPRADVDALLPALRRWVRRRDPGFVHGLSRAHEPVSHTWDDDADRALAALDPAARPKAGDRAQLALDALAAEVDALAPDALRRAVLATLRDVAPHDRRLLRLLQHRYPDLKGHNRLARVRKALQAETREGEAHRSAPKDAPPPDWPFWHLTRGKTAVIVGGDPRAAHRDRIRQAFDFARVEWPEHDATLLSRLADRAASGSVDVFLFNRFGGHVMDDIVLAPIRGDLSRWVRIDRSYGVSGVRQAMEQHWAALAAPDTPHTAAAG